MPLSLVSVEAGIRLFFYSHPMNKTYLCPHCHEEQTDAVMTSDGFYLDRDDCVVTYDCPSCFGPLNADHLAQLDGESPA